MAVTTDDVRRIALALPGATEHLVRDRVKLKVGRLVFVAFSRDERQMGFGYPKDARAALVDSEPDKFLMPSAGDLRYQWVEARLAALDLDEMAELVTDAWAMCVPKSVARAYFASRGLPER